MDVIPTGRGLPVDSLPASVKYFVVALKSVNELPVTDPLAPAVPVTDVLPASLHILLISCATRSVERSVTPPLFGPANDNPTFATGGVILSDSILQYSSFDI